MGITYSSTSKNAFKDLFDVKKDDDSDYVIALAGNPNTGKSTVFNALTGLNQHTGNWPGKTVVSTQGKYTYKDNKFIVVDLPGTYSLIANSQDEIIARDFICFGKPNVVVIVVDATCLQRNLNLVLQICELTDKIVVCLNLMDEAKRKNIEINIDKLSHKLGVPIVPTTARNKKGLNNLRSVILDICAKRITTNPYTINYSDNISQYINSTAPKLQNIFKEEINSKWLALRLLDGDKSILDSISKYTNYNFTKTMLKEDKIDE